MKINIYLAVLVTVGVACVAFGIAAHNVYPDYMTRVGVQNLFILAGAFVGAAGLIKMHLLHLPEWAIGVAILFVCFGFPGLIMLLR